MKVHALVLCPVLLAHSWFNYSFDTVLFLYEKSWNMGADKLFEFTNCLSLLVYVDDLDKIKGVTLYYLF